MKKARRKFVFYAVLAVFASLVILLGAINMLTFTMAAEDADKLTEMISNNIAGNGNQANRGGSLEREWPFGKQGFGPMGPDAPDAVNSLRYFTIALDKEGNATVLNYKISAVEQEEAIAWAKTLKKESTGWTRGTYRYRVIKRDGVSYVTVIDQGREVLAAYRILIFSVCGTVLGTVLSFIILRLVSKRLFAPLEEADRKQKKFIAAAEQEFKLPLTVMNADIEIIERENGSTEQSRSIHRQINKMTTLVKNVGDLNVFEEDRPGDLEFAISETLKAAVENSKGRLLQAGIAIETDIEDARFKGNPEAFEKAFGELMENILKYADSKAVITLRSSNGRIKIGFCNDTGLKDGEYDQVFDRFVTLENALEGSAGLGLASVKSAVDRHNGRIHAKVENNMFVLGIDL